MISKADLVVKMQQIVEDFDFEQEEPKKAPEPGRRSLAYSSSGELYGCISYACRTYDRANKAFNFSTAYYKRSDKAINPKLILRFDCR